jgi:hypothetical protein
VSTEDQLLLLARSLYWTMPVVIALWGWALVVRWRSERWSVGALLRRHGAGVAVALAATAVCFVLVPPVMRVQFDETSLASVAQNMHEQRSALLTTGAVPFDGGLMRLENMVDKRPPLFAFLVSVLHDVTGERLANAFVVNAALLVALLTLASALARRWLDRWTSLLAPVLLVATPLVPVVATSAGFELLAAVLFLVVLLAALDVVERPEPPRVLWFVASGLLFAQSRYESFAVLAVVAVVVLCRTRGRLRLDRRVVVALCLAPVLLAPVGLLLLHAQNPNFYPEAAGRPLVAFAHLIDHAGPFALACFAPWLDHVWPGPLAIVGVLGWAVWRFLHRGALGTDLLVLLPVLAATGIVLLWFHGDVNERTAVRLFVPAAVALALAPLFWCRLLGPRFGVLLAAPAVALAAVRVSDLHRGEVFPQLEQAKLIDALDGALAQSGTSPGDTLWVTVAAQHLIVKGHAALSPEAFVRRSARPAGQPSTIDELFARGDIRRIMLVETPLDEAFAPAFGSMKELLDAIPTEVVGRFDAGMAIVVRRAR